MFALSNFWIFCGFAILLSIIVDGIVKLVKHLMSPWKHDNHFHINDVNIDVNDFIEWQKEKKEEE